jgi:carbamoyl-phosphate synthase large subunit
MREPRILVTAAGSGPGVAVVKALRLAAGFDAFVVAVDMSDRAAGLFLAHERALVPRAEDAGYLDRILEVATEHAVNMIIPIFDTETPVFAQAGKRFRQQGIHVAVNPLGCILKANDKALSFAVCAAAGIAQPPRFEHPDRADPAAYPIVGKPLQGVGAKGLVMLEAPGGLPPWIDPAAFIWQSWIRGPEYSIDTFGDPDSAGFVAVPRLRRLVKAGQMVDGETVDDPALTGFAREVCRAFGARDVCCVQVIRDAGGGLYFIEINPRYGTGVSLTIQAGVHLPRLQWLSAFAPESITPDLLRFRAGAGVIRYWEEIYL